MSARCVEDMAHDDFWTWIEAGEEKDDDYTRRGDGDKNSIPGSQWSEHCSLLFFSFGLFIWVCLLSCIDIITTFSIPYQPAYSKGGDRDDNALTWQHL